MESKKIFNKRNFFLAPCFIFIFAIAYLNDDRRVFLLSLIFLLLGLSLRRTIIIKVIPLVAIIAIPALIIFQKQELLELDFRLLFDSTLILIWILIYEFKPSN